MSKYKLKVFITQTLLVLVFFTLWEVFARIGFINTFIFSSPSKILSTLINLIVSKELFIHLGVTFLEVLIAFIIGIAIGFIVSILMYLCKFFTDVIDPFLTMLNSLPKVALGPIIIIWAGANTKSIILMALLINVIISIITMYTGFINTDKVKIKLFKSFDATKWQILTKLIIPANKQTIVSALKINISLTFIGLVPPVGEKIFFNKCYSRY